MWSRQGEHRRNLHGVDTMVKVNLRRATADEAGALAQVHLASWKAAYRGIVPEPYLEQFTIESGIERFRSFLASDPEKTYLAESGGRIAGFLTFGVCRDEDLDPASCGEIWGIYLSPEYWRRGIGTSICRQAEDMLASLGCSFCTLWVFEANNRARGFYEAMGFQPDGASKEVKLGVPLRAIRYRKSLAGG
jgi:ribosomal protein S18 acetylase RimI-like enzyme